MSGDERAELLRGKIVEKTADLVPDFILHFLRVAAGQSQDINELIEFVDKNEEVRDKVTRMANSSVFLRETDRKSSQSLGEAITRIGVSQLSRVLVCEGLVSTLVKDVSPEFGRFFLGHSLRCYIVAQEICRLVSVSNEGALVSASLLHDIGKLALAYFFGEEYCGAINVLEGGSSFLERERSFLKECDGDSFSLEEIKKIDHLSIGYYVLDRLGLWPLPLAAAMHHHPAGCAESYKKTASFVFVVNAFSRPVVEGGSSGSSLAFALRELKLSTSQIERALDDLDGKEEEASSVLGF